MSYARQMLDTHPRAFAVDADVLAAAIDALSDCVQACNADNAADLSEPDVTEMVRCIRLCLDCVDVCTAAMGVLSRQAEYDASLTRPLLVGWSYGALVAAHWVSRHPDRALGAVLVDGAYPGDWLDEAMEQRIRKLFRRMGWITPLLRPTGLTPRMTAEQQADSNIELGKLSRVRELGPVLDDITVPVRYVVASGTSFGSRGDEQERLRASLDAVTVRNPNIEISAKVASNHGAILRKDSPAIAEAVREVAAGS